MEVWVVGTGGWGEEGRVEGRLKGEVIRGKSGCKLRQVFWFGTVCPWCPLVLNCYKTRHLLAIKKLEEIEYMAVVRIIHIVVANSF